MTEPPERAAMWPAGTFDDFLARIERRPAMFAGSHDVEDLRLVLQGWQACQSMHRIDDPAGERFFEFDGFDTYVAERFGDGAEGWARVLKRHANGREPLALFFETYRDFRDSVGA